MPVYLARPEGEGPWPGVVIVHDASGMGTDLRGQAEWLAGAGYLTAAPDLYYWGRRAACMFRFLREAPLGDVDAVRDHLAGRTDCSGRIGVIGFCMGGGFALMLAPGHGYSVASVNYGALLPGVADPALEQACPIVGSYGGRDYLLRGAAERLRRTLTAGGVDHDVKEYPDAGHGFLNDHAKDDVPVPMRIIAGLTGTRFHDVSARDARERILTFFARHLRQDG
ncbi:MAG: dienelactone hydrolase family protein [Streptosporangiales bacterium]|nr:dienelactone hydrolase family protein [Streptosporangiales bacterium]